MAYNEEIDDRICSILSTWENTDRKKMFGGVCHLLNGNMICGVLDDYLILRLGAFEAGRALERDCVKPFDVTGRPMKGWVMVSREGLVDDAELKRWITLAEKFVRTLPPK